MNNINVSGNAVKKFSNNTAGRVNRRFAVYFNNTVIVITNVDELFSCCVDLSC